MSEATARRLSRLHSLSTLMVDMNTIENRAREIDSLCGGISPQQAVTAAAVATGLTLDLSRVAWLTKPVSEADPSFAPVEVDKSVAAACSTIVTTLLAGDNYPSLAAALAVLSLRMGQSDRHIDDRLYATAQHRLWDIQRAPLPEAKLHFEDSPKELLINSSGAGDRRLFGA